MRTVVTLVLLVSAMVLFRLKPEATSVASGVSRTDLVASGFSRKDSVASGFSRKESVASGFSRKESVASGFSRKDTLRVCADPNNLPFSNRRGEGFENRLAQMLARELGTTVEYTWWAQRRGFVRNTLNTGRCDVVMGVPAGMDPLLTTMPYYRSTYVFVTQRARGLHIRSFDDPALRRLRVGVQLVGDDGANSPPAHALSRRGIVQNLVGYSVYGDYKTENPPAAIIAAVARGDVDVVAAWGPLAGYFAARQRVPLDLAPVAPAREGAMPQVFDIAMGVRRGDTARRERLDRFIREHRPAIDALLAAFGVPRVDR